MSFSHAGGQKRKWSKKEMKADSINGHYQLPFTMKHDHLDDLMAAMRLHRDMFGQAC